MKLSLVSSAVAFALSVPLWASAASTSTITFNPNGTGAAGAIAIDDLDWKPGNALAVGGNPSAGLKVGSSTSLLYQANLGTASFNGDTYFSQGIGSTTYFTAVAQFQETVTSVTGSGFASNVSFGLNGSTASSTNYFKVYANTTGNGNNLTGTGFTNGTVVLSGHISSLNSSNFTATLDGSGNPVITDLDKFGTNNYSGTTTIVGSGATDLTVTIDSVDANYFPSLSLSTIAFSFFNTSQVLPFTTVDPSAAFSSDGITSANLASNIGSVNGLPGATNRNFQFLADGNSAFNVTTVPEPSSIALAGLAFAALGVATRRKTKRGA